MARHRARQQALHLLYQWDIRRTPLDEVISGYYGSLLVSDEDPSVPERDEFAETLFRGVVDTLPAIDDIITRHASNWKIPRMPSVDRNIIRLAVHELLTTDTPAAVVIDEALELARRFSGEDSIQFVNGVLDAVRKDIASPKVEPVAETETPLSKPQQ